MQEKSKIVAYVLWLLVGAFGAHRFYLGRIKTGAVMALLLVGYLVISGLNGYYMAQEMLNNETSIATITNPTSTFMIITYVTFAMILVWLCWYLIDLVLIHLMMQKDKKTQTEMSSRQAEDVFG